ncbi:uncharacterized protein TNCV_738281 [Trichonephila clavipes]|nr:uncharacterized protein TNCV_738281 [Trichonephila clavipes]
MPSIGGYHPYGLASILTGLNPIEHMWDMIGRRIAARQPPPTFLPELRRALLDEWCNIPQDQIDNLILSMPRLFALFPSLLNYLRAFGDGPVAGVPGGQGIESWFCMSRVRAQCHKKTRRVGHRCTLNLSRAAMSSRWCGVVVRRGGASSGVALVI